MGARLGGCRAARTNPGAEAARLSEIIQTIRAEYGSRGRFVRRWRPLFGYMIALTWGLQTAAIAFAMVSEPEYAAGIVNAVVALTPMWGLGLRVLGIPATWHL